MLTVFSQSFAHISMGKTTPGVCVLPHVIVIEVVLSISFISDAVFLSVKENLIQVSCFFISAIINAQ
jgi:hypothetical protein